MNWTKNITLFLTARRVALLFCAFFLLSQCVSAENITVDNIKLDKDGFLTIEKDKQFTIGNEDGSPAHFNNVASIIIESGGSLELLPSTEIHLGGGQVTIRGKLVMPNAQETRIYSSTSQNPNSPMSFHLNAGTLQIVKGNSDETLVANTITTVLHGGGGKVDIAGGVTFQSGTIVDASGTNQASREIIKTGEGIWQVGKVGIAGIFTVEGGEVVLLDGASVGKLDVRLNTIISGMQSDEETKSDLVVQSGGEVRGTLKDIGHLILNDKELTFFGNTHTIERIKVDQKAVLNIKDGTNIVLDASKDPALRVDNGTVHISTAAQLHTSDSKHAVIELFGSSFEVEKSKLADDSGILDATTFDFRVIGGGAIAVESGAVLQSGKIMGRLIQTSPNAAPTGSTVVVMGGGTLETAGVDVEDGLFHVRDKGTRVDVREVFSAGTLFTEAETLINAHTDAEFFAMNIAGKYDGQGTHDLTIQRGGLVRGGVGGEITGVNTLTLANSGNLFLELGNSNTDTPMISVETFTITKPDETKIQIIGGKNDTFYKDIIQVKGGNTNDMTRLYEVLKKSGTALYRPEWTRHATTFDLDLTIYTVQDYVHKEWRKSGQNMENIGRLVDRASGRDANLQIDLSILTEAQLENMLKHAAAGELVGNAMRFAMHQPAHAVFRQLDNTVPLRSPFFVHQFAHPRTRGQVRDGFNLWFNAFGQAEHARSGPATFDGYNMSRHGFYLGGDIEIYNRAITGVVFGYASPYVKSDLGRITANDYAAAVYFRVPTAWEVMLNGIVGFGSQDYQYKSRYNDRRFDTKFNGSSLFASVELSRPLSFSLTSREINYRLTPLMALDFQTASMNGFIVHNPILGDLRIEPNDLNSTAIRLGLQGETMRLRSRVQYIRQIAGRDFVSSSTSLVDSKQAQTPAEIIQSTKWGKDRLNVGVGYELLAVRHWRIFADYNFDLTRRTTSHLGSINTALKW